MVKKYLTSIIQEEFELEKELIIIMMKKIGKIM